MNQKNIVFQEELSLHNPFKGVPQRFWHDLTGGIVAHWRYMNPDIVIDAQRVQKMKKKKKKSRLTIEKKLKVIVMAICPKCKAKVPEKEMKRHQMKKKCMRSTE